MKKINFIYIATIFVLLNACSKKDKLDVDLSTYNSDNYVPTEVDDWISKNLTDPYNIQVVYRFERNLTDVSRDIAPVKLENVQPTMEAVINSFLKTYEKVAGATFIRTYTPKQFVLYGSGSYNSNGSLNLGTADGGRRVVLYELNSLDVNNGDDVKRRIRTIHHEFTHILNQNIRIPANFELVTRTDYFDDWTNSSNTAEVAKSLGFVSPYARKSFGEDFAEMTAHMLVEGQIWFDNYVLSANADAASKLRQKEAIVKDYFRTYFNIDFNELQAEIQDVLTDTYHATVPVDLTQTLPIWLIGNKVSTITIDTSAAHYTQYGSSGAFNTLYKDFRSEFRESNPGWDINYFQFVFTSGTEMSFRVGFNTGTATVYLADFYFSYTVDPVTGSVRFTKATLNSADFNGNGSYVNSAFEKYMLSYLTNRTFVADWLPTTVQSDSPLYRTFGGFYVQGAPDNYFYGPIVLK